MFVPVVFAFNGRHAHHGVVHLAQGLIEPLVFVRARNRVHIDQLKRLVKDIESCFIGENCALSHGKNLEERIAGAPARLYRQIQKLILPLTLTLRHVRRWSVNEERRTADL
jgi:hypothetical protein